MKIQFTLFVALTFSSGSLLASESSDFSELAPPSFPYGGSQAVPVDFVKVDLDLDFKLGAASKGRAKIEFNSVEAGFPIFDLVPSITSARLNGRSVSPASIPEVSPPDQATKFRVLKSPVFAGSSNLLEIEFDINYGDLSSGRARVGFFMSDLARSGREFWEQYGPANFEFDQFAMTVNLSVSGTQTNHELFSNGEVEKKGSNVWTINFPEYFTTSSFFLHLSEAGRFKVEESVFVGNSAQVPVTVYSLSADQSRRGLQQCLDVMKELETIFGDYSHDRVVFYITEGGGGMEHVGAAVTSLWALGHEMTHSWFARGVMPANGNAGWVDEAIASWRDDGFPRASSAPNRSPVNLGGFSVYKRDTTDLAYTLGNKLISEFDLNFKDIRGENQSGMKFILSKFYDEYARRPFTVHQFKSFLENVSGVNLDQIFSRYVFGKSSQFDPPKTLKSFASPWQHSRHPRPFTSAERQKIQ
jgi:hypothetical protein